MQSIVKNDLAATISNLSSDQAQQFIHKLITKNPELLEDLKIFLQGSKESTETTETLINKYRAELMQIDPEWLLESWYEYNEQYEHDDGYWGDSMEEGNEENKLSIWIDKILVSAEKYSDNGNHLEAIKICSAALQAFSQRGAQLEPKFVDLSDWFDLGIDRLNEALSFLVEKSSKADGH